MKKLFKTLAIVAIFGIMAFAGNAWAQGISGVVDELSNVFNDVRTVFYILAAFGLIGMAAGALLGKVKWSWLWALVFGVAVVACADFIVSYAAGGSQGQNTVDLGNMEQGYI
ncbi:MAG: hypothetical protein E7021_02085 [Alphaproteobacteria bacterium]|nr:hypothetical protein [Alphaproteobacteria bacterium]